ncbi:MAG: DUF2155 domain-containing protein [Alphaproteobacteria bacterium]|nr:MAG: DUF2155 domain-containing protein [Alphaproteobacteria bacterium]
MAQDESDTDSNDDTTIAPDYFDEDLFGTSDAGDDAEEDTDADDEDTGTSDDFFDNLKIGGETEVDEDESSIGKEDIEALPSIAPQAVDNIDYASYWDTAVFRALDKVTGRISVVEAPLEVPTAFERFEIVVHQCNKRPPEETPNTTAFVDVEENTLDGERKDVFTGWMFASSPGLNAVEHPVYDVWLIDCKRVAPVTTEVAPEIEEADPEGSNQDEASGDTDGENNTDSTPSE